METIIQDTLRHLKLGEPQRFKSLEVFPLFLGQDSGPDYLTLKQALAQQKIVVTETTESGSVPQLKVVNRGNEFVLLIDGEELMGAKQNRVLNTSILVKSQTEITIPVSCTEHGRWSYVSREFRDSELAMAPHIRAAKIQSVTSSLKFDRSFSSDQSQVWDQIGDLQAKARVASPTGAMKDVYTSKETNLDGYVEAMPSLPGQCGLQCPPMARSLAWICFPESRLTLRSTPSSSKVMRSMRRRVALILQAKPLCLRLNSFLRVPSPAPKAASNLLVPVMTTASSRQGLAAQRWFAMERLSIWRSSTRKPGTHEQ